jgi:hypothetical protein
LRPAAIVRRYMADGFRFMSIRSTQYPALAAARCFRVCPLTVRLVKRKTCQSAVSIIFANA